MPESVTPAREMDKQARFWFGYARRDGVSIGLAVAAFTERSARLQVRKLLGASARIELSPMRYAHAWKIDFSR